jgi:hypothetical protein
MKHLLSIMLFGFLINCNPKNSEKETDAVIKEGSLSHQTDPTLSLVLNQGGKWKVNTEMLPHLLRMEDRLRTFEQSKEKDFKDFGEKSQQDLDLLIASCTMKGESHEQLHKWLIPHIQLVKDMAVVENSVDGSKLFKEMEHSFNTFNEYFH